MKISILKLIGFPIRFILLFPFFVILVLIIIVLQPDYIPFIFKEFKKLILNGIIQ